MNANKLRKLAGIQQIKEIKANKVLSEELSNESLLNRMHDLGEELLRLQDEYRDVLSTNEMNSEDNYLRHNVQLLATHLDDAIDNIKSIVEFLENN